MQDEKINGMDAGAWRYDRPDGMWGGTTSASSEPSEAVSETASETASEIAASASESSVAADLAKEQEAADLSASEAATETETAEAEQVLLDNDLVKVTLQDKIEEADYYIGYSALIENKSADQYLSLGIDQSSVDGLMTYIDVQGGSVAPGKKSKAEFRIYTDDSDIKTLDDLKNVEGVFTIATNTDGGSTYTYLEDKYPFSI